ncbi:MAG: hypothetical protein ACRDKL_12320 [Solirubrobacteraceae bacterium]
MSVRFGEPVHQSLARFAHRTGQAKSSVVNTAVSEWLAMQAHPRIRFVTIETGERRAALVDGPQVWTVAEAWLAHAPTERDAAALADALGLSPIAAEAGLAYWADHRTEIDGIIERHRAAQDEALGVWERRQLLEQS